LTDGERANEILLGGIGRRLTYRRIDKLAAKDGEAAPRYWRAP